MNEWKDWAGMFITVPALVVMEEELSGDEKILFGVILGLSRVDGYCRATNAYLAKLMRISDRSVQRNIASLKKAGFIDVEIIRDERGEVQERQLRCMISFRGASKYRGVWLPKMEFSSNFSTSHRFST